MAVQILRALTPARVVAFDVRADGVVVAMGRASITRPYIGTYSDLVDVVALASNRQLRPPIQRSPLDEALLAFDELEAGRLTGRAVLVPGS